MSLRDRAVHLIGSCFNRLHRAGLRHTYDGFRATYDIAPDFRFNGPGILLYGNGALRIGARSYIGEWSTVLAQAPATVTIGTDCQIGHNVRIYSASASAEDLGEQILGDVRIGDRVWIGVNVFIGPGRTIGDDAVIGANSVVTSDVGVGAIVGGVPARLIRQKPLP